MKNIVLILLVLFLLAATCCKDDELTIRKQPYFGDELRTDGYYYRKENNQYLGFPCFYRDGCLLLMSGRESSLELVDNYIESVFGYKRNCSGWGIFLIQNEGLIRLEYYRGSDCGWQVYVEEGTILNDTTFKITTLYRVDGSDKQGRNDIYHFRQFYPKPDSTNTFIK